MKTILSVSPRRSLLYTFPIDEAFEETTRIMRMLGKRATVDKALWVINESYGSPILDGVTVERKVEPWQKEKL